MSKKTSHDDVKEVLDGCDIDDLPDPSSYISTGCSLLNIALSNKIEVGIPLGRIIQIFGGSATCKSVLGHTLLGYALRSDMEAFLADVEHALDPRFASMFGFDIENEKCHVGEPDCLEQMFDKWIGGAIEEYEDKPKIMVVDSITSLPSKHELDKGMMDTQSRAPRAKTISEGLRRYIRKLSETNTTLFCVDQTRTDMSGYGGEVTSGGRGLEFYASTRIYLKHEAHIQNSKGINVGIWVKFIVKKNRVAPPFRQGSFRLLYDYGVDDISSNLRWLAEMRGGTNNPEDTETWSIAKSKKAEGKKKIPGLLEQVSLVLEHGTVETNSIKKWVREVEERGLEETLKQNVKAVWDEVYKPEVRKQRVW